MSAFVVEDKTINRVIFWLDLPDNRESRKSVLEAAEISDTDLDWTVKLGISMAQMNVDAVNQRYDAHDEALFEFEAVLATDIQVFKSLQCWMYQCAEGDVPERKFFKAFEEVKGHLAAEIVSRIPEYEKAVWG